MRSPLAPLLALSILSGVVQAAEPVDGGLQDEAPDDCTDLGETFVPDPCESVEAALARRPLTTDALPALTAQGSAAMPALVEALAEEPDPDTVLVLLEAIVQVSNVEADQAIRHHLFSGDPTVAAAATRAMAVVQRGRAVPVLERLLREDRSFPQTRAALQALAAWGNPLTVNELRTYADDPARDPELRAEAAKALVELDPQKARKWLRTRKPTPDPNPFFRAEIERLTRDLMDPGPVPTKTVR